MKMAVYRFIRWIVRLVYPKTEIIGLENLPEGPAVIVGNHTQMHGPITGDLFIPPVRYIWCAGEMMHLKDVPAYAFKDFWSEKPKSVRWFFKILSYIIAPLAVCIFNENNTIGVYHDNRIIGTFKTTVAKLAEKARIVIFPESSEKRNNIIYEFNDGYLNVARLYYRKTKEKLKFVPMYVAPALKQMHICSPIEFDPEADFEEEKKRINEYLMNEITEKAYSLPHHTVVPFKNIPKSDYPDNTRA